LRSNSAPQDFDDFRFKKQSGLLNETFKKILWIIGAVLALTCLFFVVIGFYEIIS
jgi:hypothetical protein